MRIVETYESMGTPGRLMLVAAGALGEMPSTGDAFSHEGKEYFVAWATPTADVPPWFQPESDERVFELYLDPDHQ